MHCLFIYGTLAPGRPNAHIMQPITGTWTPATVRGTKFEQGWGAALGYPGLVLDNSDHLVEGFVFASYELPAHWARLDEFEGEGYERVLTTATLDSGEQIETYVYQLSDKGRQP